MYLSFWNMKTYLKLSLVKHTALECMPGCKENQRFRLKWLFSFSSFHVHVENAIHGGAHVFDCNPTLAYRNSGRLINKWFVFGIRHERRASLTTLLATFRKLNWYETKNNPIYFTVTYLLVYSVISQLIYL